MVYDGSFSITREGTPQGGIISPMLCNVALNGLENTLKAQVKEWKETTPKLKIIRYADDIVITGRTKELLLKCQKVLDEFLEKRGLRLNEKKTRVTDIKEGIDLLGFNIRKMP